LQNCKKETMACSRPAVESEFEDLGHRAVTESRGTTSLNCSCTLRWIAKPHEPGGRRTASFLTAWCVSRLGLHARRVHEDSQATRQRSSKGGDYCR
jgi:hypothetical protein